MAVLAFPLVCIPVCRLATLGRAAKVRNKGEKHKFITLSLANSFTNTSRPSLEV
jgi:hypothetical protein